MASTTFSGPVTSTAGLASGTTVTTGTYLFANLPAAASNTGAMVFCSNALKAAETTGNGTGNLLFSDGTNWIRVDTGATAAA